MTTNRMGLTPEQAANTFTDEQLESLAYGNNPQSNVYRELLAYRKASKETVAWTDEVELRSVEKDGCGYLFKANPITPHADPRRVIMLYAAPPLQAVTVPNGWQLVPIEPTYEMSKAIGLPWEFPPFPLRWKRMLEACSPPKSVTNEP